MRNKLLATFLLLPLCGSTSAAPPLPEDQWNEEAAIWLARAFVGEADWSARDHAAIAWVLQRRWKRNELSFEQTVRAYCAPLKGSSPRHRWVQTLNFAEREPRSWPVELEWSSFRPRWREVVDRAFAWGEGTLGDPCGGLADHWGAPYGIDLERAQRFGWRRVDCGPTVNAFWSSR